MSPAIFGIEVQSHWVYGIAGLILDLSGVFLLAVPELGSYRDDIPIVGELYRTHLDNADSIKAARDKLFSEGHVLPCDDGFDSLCDEIMACLDDHGKPIKINRIKVKNEVQIIYEDRDNSEEVPVSRITTMVSELTTTGLNKLDRRFRIIGSIILLVGLLLQAYAFTLGASTS
ncbi:hypothetical protein [Halogranum amylolyticum]|uniref:hypothetical protein n=1 Tax=Halogranum amylolyticum TaxID=660520 RepID=UPI001114DF7C|nr:hypothetical protein [Halogranum amylolyticum]